MPDTANLTLQQTEPDIATEKADANANTQNNTEPVTEPAEKMISKATYDKKVAELNKLVKEYKEKLNETLNDDQKAAQAQQEAADALKTAQDEIFQLRTEKALTNAGMSGETAEKLAAAIVSGDAENIVDAVKDALTATENAAVAKTKEEILKNGSPKVPVGADAPSNDPMMDKIKAVQAAKVTSGQAKPSKWIPNSKT